MSDLTLVIPAKYESTTLPTVIKELKNSNLKLNIIIVVPKYDLETINAIKEFDCKLLLQDGEGFGNAIRQGISSSTSKYTCIFNADGSFDPKYLSEMIKKLENNSDFVFNSRYEKDGGSEDDTVITFIGNKIFTFICNFLFSLNISDVLFTYAMGKTSCFNDLNLTRNDFTFCIELPVKAKFKNYNLTSLPSYERSRISGKKKVNELKDGFLILMSIIKLFIIKK